MTLASSKDIHIEKIVYPGAHQESDTFKEVLLSEHPLSDINELLDNRPVTEQICPFKHTNFAFT